VPSRVLPDVQFHWSLCGRPSLASGARQAVADDDRCNIENITKGLRVIAEGPSLCQAVSSAFVEHDPGGDDDAA